MLNNWKFYFLICVLLFVSGLVAGQAFSFKGDLLEKITKVTAVVSSLVTMFGVLLAFIAFNSWKLQYKNAKLDSLIDRLEDSFIHFHRSVGRYYYDTLMVAKNEDMAGATEIYKALNEKKLNSKYEYFDKRNSYSFAYSKLERHLKLVPINAIKPNLLTLRIVDIMKSVSSIYTKADVHESDQLLVDNDKLLSELFSDGKNAFIKLRASELLTSN
jgi:hypothetical protein